MEQARRAIDVAKVEAEVHVLVIRSAAEAERLRFLGSPTVRVDEVDVEPSSRSARGLRSSVPPLLGRWAARLRSPAGRLDRLDAGGDPRF